MFRARANTRSKGDEPTAIIASPFAVPPVTKKSSKASWKPALKKLFSKKDSALDPEKRKTQGTYTNIIYPTKQGFEEPKVLSLDSSRSDGDDPVRPKSSHHPASSTQSPKSAKESRRRSFIHTITLKKSTKDLQDREFQKFYAAKETEEKGLLRQYREDYVQGPGTAAYVPKHAAKDSYSFGRQWAPDPNRPSTANAAYAPKETPTDVPSVPEVPSIEKDALQEIPVNAAPAPSVEAAATLQPTAFESEDQEADFQKFLRESRLAAGRNIGPENFPTPSPRARPLSAAVMDNIMATRQIDEASRQTTDLQRAKSTASKKTAALKAAHRKSVIGSVGNYIKPSRPHTMYHAGPPVLDDWHSMDGSIYKSKSGGAGEKSWKDDGMNRLSRVGGSFKKSISRDRDAENDERARAARALAIRDRRRRSMLPPGHPSLDRFNHTTAHRTEWA